MVSNRASKVLEISSKRVEYIGFVPMAGWVGHLLEVARAAGLCAIEEQGRTDPLGGATKMGFHTFPRRDARPRMTPGAFGTRAGQPDCGTQPHLPTSLHQEGS